MHEYVRVTHFHTPVCLPVTVARARALRAGQVLRDGAQREGAPPAALPGLERARQLRHALQEQEEAQGALQRRRRRQRERLQHVKARLRTHDVTARRCWRHLQQRFR